MTAILLRSALVLVGIWLLFEALRSLASGETVGREGRKEGPRSVVRRGEMPGYFRFLVVNASLDQIPSYQIYLFINRRSLKWGVVRHNFL